MIMNEGESELLAAVAQVIRVFDDLGIDYLVEDRSPAAFLASRDKRSMPTW